MRRKEAEKLIGTRVHVWTGMNGRYVGVLEKVTEDRPWRGIVLIDGVENVADWSVGRRRRGSRIGERINAGHSSITPICEDDKDWRDSTYEDTLRDTIASLEATREKVEERPPEQARRDLWWIDGNLKFYREQLAKLESGEWT